MLVTALAPKIGYDKRRQDRQDRAQERHHLARGGGAARRHQRGGVRSPGAAGGHDRSEAVAFRCRPSRHCFAAPRDKKVGLMAEPSLMAKSRNKRSITIARHRTSISVEDAFWEALCAFAEGDGRSVADLVGEIDKERGGARPTRNKFPRTQASRRQVSPRRSVSTYWSACGKRARRR